ncbi:hypothetical protein [Streptomyces sp. NPDC051211]|uniref:hypothetical protein n=1 Tax=Streptomyces sp. NPDC051211 TaxID=3154643 RepID=UPI00345089B9
MGTMEQDALVSAYRLAEPSMAAELIRRTRGATLDLLRHGHRLPRQLTETVLASDDRELQVALAHNAAGNTPDQRLSLARLGDP